MTNKCQQCGKLIWFFQDSCGLVNENKWYHSRCFYQ